MTDHVHLPVCWPCAEAIRQQLPLTPERPGCGCDIFYPHFHEEPGVYVQSGPHFVYCPPCIMCGQYCTPEAVLCADIEEMGERTTRLLSYEFSELESAPEEVSA